MGPAHLRAASRRRWGCTPTAPDGGDAVAIVTRATLSLDRSYLAIQGPPGSGKSWTAAQVIRDLVDHHHWRVAVVAQSHAVVEHLLDGIVDHGLDPPLVGKSGSRTASPGRGPRQRPGARPMGRRPPGRGARLRPGRHGVDLLG